MCRKTAFRVAKGLEQYRQMALREEREVDAGDDGGCGPSHGDGGSEEGCGCVGDCLCVRGAGDPSTPLDGVTPDDATAAASRGRHGTATDGNGDARLSALARKANEGDALVRTATTNRKQKDATNGRLPLLLFVPCQGGTIGRLSKGFGGSCCRSELIAADTSPILFVFACRVIRRVGFSFGSGDCHFLF